MIKVSRIINSQELYDFIFDEDDKVSPAESLY